ncbi:hypothetical protein DFA_04986 [Cavenderia fasciculata]|uniref:Ankyrin repeat-containing protein n=1 Tax=Cavenderia fasciculata TaxID=261658 RepID=F4PMQ9_CACFS|nr:uncharacterized protein DFA_04986 [Cavenderia fasciculata]EGG22856.1 hypothetical protein DFA_04986 [Cavenderia fasciculata]|eukprot:XP_004360707.1 hypothetical protein DFA_04986 [Cavenderia fasciculata]
MYSNSNNSDSDKRRSEYFKGILNNKYLRTKIFNHVEIIHHRIINNDDKNHYKLALKSNQIMTLCECIKVNRSDLFIKHFDSVYQSMLSYSNEKEFSFNSQVFEKILKTIFEYDGHVELEYLLKRFGGIEMTKLRSMMLRVGFVIPPIGLCRLLIQQNYHLKLDMNDKDVFTFVGNLTKHVMMNGDLEMFDRICNDYFDHTIINQNLIFYHHWGSFKDLINKLNNQQQQLHTTNNKDNNNIQSKYIKIFYMVNKLIGYGIDLRSTLFVDALEGGNNQEIIKWIKDSFDEKESFVKLFQQSQVLTLIERYATTNTLELIEFKLESPRLLSIDAAQFGNLDFLTYMYDMKEYNYLFGNGQLEASLTEGHLECANFLVTCAVKEGAEVEFGDIHPSIMSLDLVKRLVDSQCQMLDFDGLIESAIESNQPETLEFIFSQLENVDSQMREDFSIYTRLVLLSLKIDNPKITEILLDKLFSDQPPQTFHLNSKGNDLCYGPLLSLFNKGHSIEILPLSRKKRLSKVTPQAVQLLIDRLSIESVPPWVILASIHHPDFNDYKLLKDTISLINQYPEEEVYQYKKLQYLYSNGLIKVIECFGDWIWEFGDSLFRTALEYNQIQMALYISQLISSRFQQLDDYEGILYSLLDIDNDQDFEMIWDALKPFTTSSSHVIHAIMSVNNFVYSQRHRVTNTIDRVIKHYTRYYNGAAEKGQFKMTPIKITNEHGGCLHFNHLYNNYRDCPVIDFTDFNVDSYLEDNHKEGIFPFTKNN